MELSKSVWPLTLRSLPIAQPYVESARSNRGFELAGGALGDDFAAVDNGDPVG
jgi:hypothetical protein